MNPEIYFYYILCLLFLLPLIATRNLQVSGLFLFSFLTIMLPLRYGLRLWVIISASLSLLLLALITIRVIRQDLFKLDQSTDVKWWRVIARPFAVLFIPIDILAGHNFLICLIGILAALFIVTDMIRLLSNKQLNRLYKKSEIRRFSSMTSFLVAIFIIFLLFHTEVAYLCLVFILIGDMSGKILGIRFGRIRLIHNRTLEGSLGFLAGALYAGLIICILFNIALPFLLIGASFATTAELFSFGIDDNFTVGMISGGCLEALIYFNVI